MVPTVTRRLLRDWKHLSRSFLYTHHAYQERFFHLKPQDSNLHVWHLVLIEPATSMELYFMLYINETMDTDIIIARCLTPCDNFPFNRNIQLSYLYPLLKEHGFYHLILKLWHMCFEDDTQTHRRENDINSNNKQHIVRKLRAWNRIMYKDFKSHFPELTGFLQPGDYEAVKSLSQKLKEYNYGVTPISPSINTPNRSSPITDNNINMGPTIVDTNSTKLNTYHNIHNPNMVCSTRPFSCDNFSPLKRNKRYSDDGSADENQDNSTNLSAPRFKRRKM